MHHLDLTRSLERIGLLVAAADSGPGPAPRQVALEHEDTFPGGQDNLVAAITVEVDELEVVDRVQRLVGVRLPGEGVSFEAADLSRRHLRPRAHQYGISRLGRPVSDEPVAVLITEGRPPGRIRQLRTPGMLAQNADCLSPPFFAVTLQ